MLSQFFLLFSKSGAEWVLYLLVLLSILSIGMMFERIQYYRKSTRALKEYRAELRTAVLQKKWDTALQLSENRMRSQGGAPDLETQMALRLIQVQSQGVALDTADLQELAQDPVLSSKILWEKNLSVLASIGSNSPFIGLFGTVLGIIKAFHDLSSQAGSTSATGAAAVSAGISEALVATAVGLLVAIPATWAYNLFLKRVKTALLEAESLKSFLIGQMAQSSSRKQV